MTEKEYRAHKQEMTAIEAAKWWFWEREISSYIENEELYIVIKLKNKTYEVKVHPNEIECRSYLYKNDIIS